MGGLFLDVCLAHISNRMPNLKCDCRKVASPCDKNACTPALRQRIVKIRKTIEFVYIVSFPTNVRGLLWNTELGFQCSESERGAKKMFVCCMTRLYMCQRGHRYCRKCFCCSVKPFDGRLTLKAIQQKRPQITGAAENQESSKKVTGNSAQHTYIVARN